MSPEGHCKNNICTAIIKRGKIERGLRCHRDDIGSLPPLICKTVEEEKGGGLGVGGDDMWVAPHVPSCHEMSNINLPLLVLAIFKVRARKPRIRKLPTFEDEE